MVLTGQGGQCRCYFGQAGADVGRHGLAAAAVVFVAGVGLGGGEAEVALTGRERITYHAEYLSSQDGAMQLPALVAASLRLPWLHQAVLRCNRTR